MGPNFNHKRWIDTQKRKIEECLPEIIAWIEKDCKFWYDLRKQQAEDEKNREIQRAKEAEIQRTKEIEEAKLMQLLTDCDNWHRAKNIRNYISAYEQNTVMKSLDQEKLKTWMDWANKKANELDPLISKEDAVLGFHKA
ncbi:hypothetical protein K8352_08770 [Flavobacteriaceae bacterium F89]|uniref:Uncharacterized protein n=1 Tax=Cerina litoralis TaxID=2874477 RepID=A0AAE3EUR1_9FLAO|nr:hypothetical protein [Cerina litoralis]MCG2460840.1 hypothetical protein [Cerina litoralis]